MSRRTFRLLKETHSLKKGALVQEKCNDGNQDFEILNPMEVAKYKDSNGNWGHKVARDAVLKQPNWFVEVFPVIPEYATKEEIKRFKAKEKK